VFVSNLIGVSLPVLLKRFNLDPAIAATPVITTVVDVVGVLILFSHCPDTSQILMLGAHLPSQHQQCSVFKVNFPELQNFLFSPSNGNHRGYHVSG
jgi:hypothetical protein